MLDASLNVHLESSPYAWRESTSPGTHKATAAFALRTRAIRPGSLFVGNPGMQLEPPPGTEVLECSPIRVAGRGLPTAATFTLDPSCTDYVSLANVLIRRRGVPTQHVAKPDGSYDVPPGSSLAPTLQVDASRLPADATPAVVLTVTNVLIPSETHRVVIPIHVSPLRVRPSSLAIDFGTIRIKGAASDRKMTCALKFRGRTALPAWFGVDAHGKLRFGRITLRGCRFLGSVKDLLRDPNREPDQPIGPGLPTPSEVMRGAIRWTLDQASDDPYFQDLTGGTGLSGTYLVIAVPNRSEGYRERLLAALREDYPSLQLIEEPAAAACEFAALHEEPVLEDELTMAVDLGGGTMCVWVGKVTRRQDGRLSLETFVIDTCDAAGNACTTALMGRVGLQAALEQILQQAPADGVKRQHLRNVAFDEANDFKHDVVNHGSATLAATYLNSRLECNFFSEDLACNRESLSTAIGPVVSDMLDLLKKVCAQVSDPRKLRRIYLYGGAALPVEDALREVLQQQYVHAKIMGPTDLPDDDRITAVAQGAARYMSQGKVVRVRHAVAIEIDDPALGSSVEDRMVEMVSPGDLLPLKRNRTITLERDARGNLAEIPLWTRSTGQEWQRVGVIRSSTHPLMESTESAEEDLRVRVEIAVDEAGGLQARIWYDPTSGDPVTLGSW